MFHVKHSGAELPPNNVPRGTFAPDSLCSQSSNPPFSAKMFHVEHSSAKPLPRNVPRGTFAVESSRRTNSIRFSTFCRFPQSLLFSSNCARNPWFLRYMPLSTFRPPPTLSTAFANSPQHWPMAPIVPVPLLSLLMGKDPGHRQPERRSGQNHHRHQPFCLPGH